MVKRSSDNMKNQLLNSLWVELLSQLGIKLARKGEIVLDDPYDKRILKWSGITEAQLIRTYRYGEEETPQRFVLDEGGYKTTIILKPESEEKKIYHLVSCWKSKSWKK